MKGTEKQTFRGKEELREGLKVGAHMLRPITGADMSKSDAQDTGKGLTINSKIFKVPGRKIRLPSIDTTRVRISNYKIKT